MQRVLGTGPAESRTTSTYLDHPGSSYLWTHDRDASEDLLLLSYQGDKTLTDVSEVDDQPGHQGQILVLGAQRLVSFSEGPA